MLNSKQQFQNRKGFSLIEFVLVIGISSMIILIIFSLYNISTNALIYADEKNETLLYGRYIIDYIKYEVRNADLIIKSDKIVDLDIRYPNNIGFVIMVDRGEKYYENNHEKRYGYHTYHLKGNLFERIAYNSNNAKYPKASQFSGYNGVYDKVYSIDDTILHYDNKLLLLSVTLGIDEKDTSTYKSTIYLYNKLDY
ncbi:prepilin-type N-terminal cleavage/methylation domain-containing protein [Tissierella sp. Yu-01]|uniref:PilW family protein n=1 Tax=Tissierella sp. Yu-01 TaxID=3035694 RepID=UPI00240D61CB|nr:prepilin-type N-terminal cleavage/methylation domain-containing protein [Tissierella sp. Yu-01]WFA09683.1 prepilin-type N-terminal cleavage/methylation domain-containing protein [Tissierella sp. Yu-01]